MLFLLTAYGLMLSLCLAYFALSPHSLCLVVPEVVVLLSAWRNDLYKLQESPDVKLGLSSLDELGQWQLLLLQLKK